MFIIHKYIFHCRIQYGRNTGERPWLTIEDTVLEQTGLLIGMYVTVYNYAHLFTVNQLWIVHDTAMKYIVRVCVYIT